MIPALTQILMGAIGSVGFALLFQVKGKRMVLFFLGGAASWGVYLLCQHLGLNSFWSQFFAAVTAALLSEILARIIHAPVPILLVPMLIPSIPGGSLYYAMHHLVCNENEQFLQYARGTVITAGAIAIGILCVTSMVQIFFSVLGHFKAIWRQRA